MEIHAHLCIEDAMGIFGLLLNLIELLFIFPESQKCLITIVMKVLS
jgi:hypothetical protein